MKRICIWVPILCACFASVAWSQQPAAKGQNNWTEFHRTNMVRWNPYENVINVHNVGHLQPKWSFATGSPVVSSPAVTNEVVYVGSNNGIVYALKASSGTKLWSYYVGHSVYSSPAVANGVMYVGCCNKIYALNARTGAKLWSYKMGGSESSPAVANGVVYIGSDDSNVYAFGLK